MIFYLSCVFCVTFIDIMPLSTVKGWPPFGDSTRNSSLRLAHFAERRKWTQVRRYMRTTYVFFQRNSAACTPLPPSCCVYTQVLTSFTFCFARYVCVSARCSGHLLPLSWRDANGWCGSVRACGQQAKHPQEGARRAGGSTAKIKTNPKKPEP